MAAILKNTLVDIFDTSYLEVFSKIDDLKDKIFDFPCNELVKLRMILNECNQDLNAFHELSAYFKMEPSKIAPIALEGDELLPIRLKLLQEIITFLNMNKLMLAHMILLAKNES